jgi:hypothetical protein
MASWAAVLALTGFHYSGVEKSMTLAAEDARQFWSNGYAWGTYSTDRTGRRMNVSLSVLHGSLTLAKFNLTDYGSRVFEKPLQVAEGQTATFAVAREK